MLTNRDLRGMAMALTALLAGCASSGGPAPSSGSSPTPHGSAASFIAVSPAAVSPSPSAATLASVTPASVAIIVFTSAQGSDRHDQAYAMAADGSNQTRTD